MTHIPKLATISSLFLEFVIQSHRKVFFPIIESHRKVFSSSFSLNCCCVDIEHGKYLLLSEKSDIL